MKPAVYRTASGRVIEESNLRLKDHWNSGGFIVAKHPDPWDVDWDVLARLGGGGQGATSKVKRKSDGELGVLKQLHRPRDAKARARMVQEVTNLSTIKRLGGQVPGVLWENTKDIDKVGEPLGLIMEFVDGPTLRQVVEKKRLTFDEAVPLILSLCETIAVGHNAGIVHRDLKPENLIVHANKTTVLDYGISFNKDDDAGLTATDEAFRNKFLSAPETTRTSPSKRDPRTDLLAICCLLYYCMTGKDVDYLLDLENKLPHERSEPSIKDVMGGDPRTSQLNQFFKAGIAVRPVDRFETVEELAARLKLVAEGSRSGGGASLSELLQSAGHYVSRTERSAIRAKFAEAANKMLRVMDQKCRSVKGQDFAFETSSMSKDQLRPDIQQCEPGDVLCGYHFAMGHRHGGLAYFADYRAIIRGTQCMIQRRDLILVTEAYKPLQGGPDRIGYIPGFGGELIRARFDGNAKPVSEWMDRLAFDPDGEPPLDDAKGEVEAWIGLTLEHILGGN